MKITVRETGSDTSSLSYKQTEYSRPITPSIETPVVSRQFRRTITNRDFFFISSYGAPRRS